MTARSLSILAGVFCLLSLCTVAYTIFDFWWLGFSVVAMADDLEREGIIDAVRAAELRDAESTPYASTGEYLMQRHDRSMATGLYLLSGIATLGFGTLAMMSYNLQRSFPHAHRRSPKI
mgnify:CR=1 FL=1